MTVTRIRLLAALITLGAGLGATSCGFSKPAAPNVLLIVVDTLRADRLGSYGHTRRTSPHLDRLAEEGVRYSRAHSQAPWTTPSVGALLTSQYPSVLGIREEPNILDDRWVTLPEVLQERGYATGAVVSHSFLGAKWNFDQGFQDFDDSNDKGHDQITSPGVTAEALRFLEEHGDEPFFLFVHYFDPHYDYLDHPERSFLPSLPAYDGPVVSGMVYTDLVELVPRLEERDLRHLLALYDSEIAFTDRAIGDLLSGLEHLGLSDDTLIVFTADHGEEFLERKTIGHGGSLYNELTHVPLILRYPNYRPTAEDPRAPWPRPESDLRDGLATDWRGATVDTPVGLIDLFPTILDYLGIAPDLPLAGRSLLGESPAAEPAKRTVFSETDWGHYRSAVLGEHKLIHRISSGERFFYDLAADPDEKQNLAARLYSAGKVEPFQRLEADLQAWLTYLDSAAGQASEVELSDEERERLRALGYLN